MPTNKKKITKVVKTAKKLNPKLEVYRKILLANKEKLVGNIRHLNDDNIGSGNDRGGDVSGHALHLADVATDMYDREFNLSLASNERELLAEIDEALHRLEDGSFGQCTMCHKPIAVTRLKALPHVKTCLKCQEQLESTKR